MLAGLLGNLQCGDVDYRPFGIIFLPNFPIPLSPLPFTLPLLYTTYQVYIKKLKTRSTEWDAYLTPFSPRLWLVLVVTIMFMSLYLATFYNIGRRIGNEEADGPELYTLYESCLYIFGAFCQQGHDITPKSTPCRIVYITAYITALVLLAAYSAALISSLTVSHSSLPFSDLDGILKYKKFKMGVMDKSEMFYTFSDINEDGIFGEVYNKLMAPDPDNFPSDTLGGLQRACNMDYAFVAIPESVMPLLNKVNCTIVPLAYKTYPISLAIAFTPDNPYREFISYRLRMLRDGGVLQRLKIINWIPLGETTTQGALISVDLSAVAPLLILLTSSVIVSVAVLLAERGKFVLSEKKSNSSFFRRSRKERFISRYKSSPRNDYKTDSQYNLFPLKILPKSVSSNFGRWHE
ncbi:hypothetical protein L9F63_008954 [Diploptera punctata]|uniref:Ionotropic glutamate receptor C-terminal domain-containing protein n=1 Tax=Diploptera punctata TaxID=6984 RepID=A0AAD7Z4C0_DIPPU|nr:hypothetical protein L9F63_008954 [Diploptera punctata]